MKPVEFHPSATAEAREAARRYGMICVGLALDFKTELAKAIERIGENPLMYAAEEGSIRQAPLGKFPYSLVYEVQEDRLWVAALAHHSRRPGYWSQRKTD